MEFSDIFSGTFKTMLKSESQSATKIPTAKLKEGTGVGVRRSHRTSFQKHKQPAVYSRILFHLETDKGNARKVTFEGHPRSVYGLSEEASRQEMIIKLPIKSPKMIAKACQTDFRESEAQTEPWRHEIRADEKLLNEFLALDFLSFDGTRLPGEDEVLLIEKARQRLAWENILTRLRGKEKEPKRRLLVSAISGAEMAMREKIRENVSEERLKASANLMAEKRERCERELSGMLEKMYGIRRRENDTKIQYWKHQYSRKLRKMKYQRTQSAVIQSSLSYVSSHLRNAPEPCGFGKSLDLADVRLKYLKKFNGLVVLEKHILSNYFQRSPARKFDYEEASKPKEIEICLRGHKGKQLCHDSDVDETIEPFLKVPTQVPSPEPATPKTERRETSLDEELNDASVFLVKIVKGRAIQTKKVLEFSKLAENHK
ncbi:hypothetical protein RUM44_003526 [Polyplax serrata]|uniref:Cilia- and flagella-associated protein 91 n=1 Tax=Polyplax serrata TaxID=468196 RepID=A0ABR1AGV9_POLSC